MTSRTDLANYALSRLGEAAITDIDDTGSNAARVCKQFMQQAIDEVLRCANWNCAVTHQALSEILPAPVSNRSSYQLPGDFLRLTEVDRNYWAYSDRWAVIEGSTLVTDREVTSITYIRRIEPYQFDPLLGRTVSAYLASLIAIPLTANAQIQGNMLTIYQRSLSEAAKIDGNESGPRTALQDIMGRSPLARSRGWGGYSACDIERIFPRW